MIGRTILVVIILSLAATTTTSADGWAVGAFIGGVTTHQNTLTLDQPHAGTRVSMDPVGYHSRSLNSPIYYGYRVTWFARRSFGVEGEFIHPKVFARTGDPVHATGTIGGEPIDATIPMNSILERFSISHGLNLLFLNAVFRKQLGRDANPRLLLTARGGAGATIPHAESEVKGRTQEQYEWGSPAFHAAVGGELRLVRVLFATMEYKFTTTNESVGVVDGTIQGRFSSHHLAVGVAWHP